MPPATWEHVFAIQVMRDQTVMSECWKLIHGPSGNTLDINLTHVGGVKGCNGGESFGTGLSYCAYLCYSNVEYGTPIIPHHI